MYIDNEDEDDDDAEVLLSKALSRNQAMSNKQSLKQLNNNKSNNIPQNSDPYGDADDANDEYEYDSDISILTIDNMALIDADDMREFEEMCHTLASSAGS